MKEENENYNEDITKDSEEIEVMDELTEEEEKEIEGGASAWGPNKGYSVAAVSLQGKPYQNKIKPGSIQMSLKAAKGFKTIRAEINNKKWTRVFTELNPSDIEAPLSRIELKIIDGGVTLQIRVAGTDKNILPVALKFNYETMPGAWISFSRRVVW